jgi:hypothetical protein
MIDTLLIQFIALAQELNEAQKVQETFQKHLDTYGKVLKELDYYVALDHGSSDANQYYYPVSVTLRSMFDGTKHLHWYNKRGSITDCIDYYLQDKRIARENME